MTVKILVGDCRDKMRELEDQSVNSVCCSPPYWGLRDYKIPPSIWGGDPKCEHVWGEITTPSANGSTRPMNGGTKNGSSATRGPKTSDFCIHCNAWRGCFGLEPTYQLYLEHMVEIFDEVWRVLRDDGIDNKARPTKAVPNGAGRRQLPPEWKQGGPNSRFHVDRVPVSRKLALHDDPDGGPRTKNNESFEAFLATPDLVPMRNKRSVWSIATQPFKEAHFATFPEKLIEPCILAGCPKGGIVLDLFGGSGTVGVVGQPQRRGPLRVKDLLHINAPPPRQPRGGRGGGG
jgi:DNA modification methylase